MKVMYRGFEIEAFKGIKGDDLISYSVVRRSDGITIFGGYTYDEQKITNFIGHLKSVVDDYHDDPTAYEVGDTNFGDDLPPDDFENEPAEIDVNAEPLEEYEDEI